MAGPTKRKDSETDSEEKIMKEGRREEKERVGIEGEVYNRCIVIPSCYWSLEILMKRCFHSHCIRPKQWTCTVCYVS